MSRFQVVELEGFRIGPRAGRTSGNATPGLSVSVLDSACAFREVARYDSEQYLGAARNTAQIRRLVRDLAAERAADLNLRLP